jgi:RNA recognition motif-containing protein
MTQIFVGNIAYNTSELDLRRAFERYGRVSSVQIMTDAQSDRPRGFAFVRMPSLDDADEAINGLSGSILNGRPLTVNESTQVRRINTGHPVSTNNQRIAALELFKALRSE